MLGYDGPIMEAFLLYGCLPAGLLGLALLLYLRSADSRQRSRCPQCGEEVQVELMTASHCSSCGAPLRPGQTGSTR